MSIRTYVVAVALLAILVMGSVASAQTEIEMWHTWGIGTAQDQAVRAIADAFERKNPGITVNVRGSAGDARERFLVAQAGGSAPDVIILSGRDIDWIEGDVIQPLTSYFERDGIGPDVFYPGVWSTMQYRGDLWVVPAFINIGLFQLAINPELLGQAGLDPTRGPETLFELEEYDRKLTRTEHGIITQIGLYPFEAWGYWNGISSVAARFGVKWYDHETQKASTGTFALWQRTIRT